MPRFYMIYMNARYVEVLIYVINFTDHFLKLGMWKGVVTVYASEVLHSATIYVRPEPGTYAVFFFRVIFIALFELMVTN